VRMLLPPLDQRREMDKNLVVFFRDHSRIAFRRAIADFCRYYHLRRPRIEWYEYIDWGKTAGKTFEDGRIHLVHPENWKRGRIYKSERMWVQMVYHELAHYLFWTDAETKAETFTRRMVRGLRRAPRRSRVVAAKGATSAARASSARSGGATRGLRKNRKSVRGGAGIGGTAVRTSVTRTGTRGRRRKPVARANRRSVHGARG